jgi:hypothetical protein
LGTVGTGAVEPPGVVVVGSLPKVVEVDSGAVVDVEVSSGAVVVVEVSSGAVVVVEVSSGAVVEEEESETVVAGLGGRRGGGVGGNKSSMVTGGHMTAASTEVGASPTISQAAASTRTVTIAAPNLPGVMGLQANELWPCWEPSHTR